METLLPVERRHLCCRRSSGCDPLMNIFWLWEEINLTQKGTHGYLYFVWTQMDKRDTFRRLLQCRLRTGAMGSHMLLVGITLFSCLLITPLSAHRTFNIGVFVLPNTANFSGLIQTAKDRDDSFSRNNITIVPFNISEIDALDEIIKNETLDAFVGCLDLEFDQNALQLASIHHRPYVSAYSPRVSQSQSQTFSMGTSYDQTAKALSRVLTHFEWQHVHIVATKDTYWTGMGMSLFVSLANRFDPVITYLDLDPSTAHILQVLRSIDDIHKVVALCVSPSNYEEVLKQADLEGYLQDHAFFIFSTTPYISSQSMHSSVGNSTIAESVFHLHPYLPNALPVQTKRRKRETWQESSFFLDAIKLIDVALHRFPSSSGVDKKHLFQNVYNMTLTLNEGDVKVNDYQEVMFDFGLFDFNPDQDQQAFRMVQALRQLSDGSWELDGLAPIKWPNGIVLGPDECFWPDSCLVHQGLSAIYILAIAISVIFVVAIATGIAISIWKNVIKKEMIRGHNKVLLTSEDLVFLQRKDVQKSSKMINGALLEKPDLLKASEKPNRSLASLHEYYDITDTARYKGDLVRIKILRVKGFEMKTKVINVVKTLRDIRHENVNAVIGLFDDQIKPAMISDYCYRGSLEDVIRNNVIKLDWDFKISLLTDLIRGVRYIHGSAIRYHGNLKSRNCVIDSRWVLKVTDFGMAPFYEAAKGTPEFEDKDLMWTAPEHLRCPVPLMKGSEKGDVYSCAIIMQEIILRSEPYSTCGLSVKEILQKLRHPPPLLRPSVSHQAAPPQYIQIMKVCWSENPDLRPTLEDIYQQFKTITGGKKMNIVDTMFRMLEKYSTDLEEIVRDRTLQLEEEKKKTDTLLYRMLPHIVADSLKFGQPVQAETFSDVTIYFSDIVGFTTISALSTPMEVVDLLNDLYTMFDATIDTFDVYKVETIGDAYMVVSGLPVRNGNKHAGQISTMALELLSACGNFKIRHMPDVPLRVRIGLHSGSCVAGVVGLTMPRFCLFGDTVNTASRMESSGTACRIHISQEVKVILDQLGAYKTEYRGEVELKGKGMARTYWLIGKDGFNKPLPEPPPLSKDGDNHGLTINIQKISNARKVSTILISSTDGTPTKPVPNAVRHSVTIEPTPKHCTEDNLTTPNDVSLSKGDCLSRKKGGSARRETNNTSVEKPVKKSSSLKQSKSDSTHINITDKERDSSSSCEVTPKKKTNIVHPVRSRTLTSVESTEKHDVILVKNKTPSRVNTIHRKHVQQDDSNVAQNGGQIGGQDYDEFAGKSTLRTPEKSIGKSCVSIDSRDVEMNDCINKEKSDFMENVSDGSVSADVTFQESLV